MLVINDLVWSRPARWTRAARTRAPWARAPASSSQGRAVVGAGSRAAFGARDAPWRGRGRLAWWLQRLRAGLQGFGPSVATDCRRSFAPLDGKGMQRAAAGGPLGNIRPPANEPPQSSRTALWGASLGACRRHCPSPPRPGGIREQERQSDSWLCHSPEEILAPLAIALGYGSLMRWVHVCAK